MHNRTSTGQKAKARPGGKFMLHKIVADTHEVHQWARRFAKKGEVGKLELRLKESYNMLIGF
jgi:hypothetical protein